MARSFLAMVPLRADAIQLFIIPPTTLESANVIDVAPLVHARCQRFAADINGLYEFERRSILRAYLKLDFLTERHFLLSLLWSVCSL